MGRGNDWTEGSIERSELRSIKIDCSKYDIRSIELSIIRRVRKVKSKPARNGWKSGIYKERGLKDGPL